MLWRVRVCVQPWNSAEVEQGAGRAGNLWTSFFARTRACAMADGAIRDYLRWVQCAHFLTTLSLPRQAQYSQ